jgi:hypothetical protein
MVTIEEAKIAQAEMNKAIALAMQKFTEETGLKVDDIDVNPIVTLGGRISYYIISTSVHL